MPRWINKNKQRKKSTSRIHIIKCRIPRIKIKALKATRGVRLARKGILVMVEVSLG